MANGTALKGCHRRAAAAAAAAAGEVGHATAASGTTQGGWWHGAAAQGYAVGTRWRRHAAVVQSSSGPMSSPTDSITGEGKKLRNERQVYMVTAY